MLKSKMWALSWKQNGFKVYYICSQNLVSDLWGQKRETGLKYSLINRDWSSRWNHSGEGGGPIGDRGGRVFSVAIVGLVNVQPGQKLVVDGCNPRLSHMSLKHKKSSLQSKLTLTLPWWWAELLHDPSHKLMENYQERPAEGHSSQQLAGVHVRE